MSKAKPILIGGDFSRHNYDVVNPSCLDFVWLKATEGRSWVDPMMHHYLEDMVSAGGNNTPFIGFYHYARAESNLPEEEAQHFLKTIEPHIGNCMLALDWEGRSLQITPTWAVRWLNYVKDHTGQTPLIYCSGSETKKLGAVATAGFPLWVAHYVRQGVKKPTFYNWSEAKFWQFTSTPFDVDIFYGSRADLVTLIKS